MGRTPKKKKAIPASVIRRLTKYLTEAQELERAETEWVSSLELAERLGLTSSTVRQDLSHLEFSGTSKRGYRVDGLVRALHEVLGADSQWKMVVVGAGNLGRALALHAEFERRDFQICAIVDRDEKKVGKRVGRLRVRGVGDLPAIIGDEGVQIGVIAVPADGAQEVADVMIAGGIKGLLNLALTHIAAPKRVAVIDSRIVASVLELAHAIKFRRGSSA